ncbi:MAG: ferredoxin [Planctomycetota bacterium]
MTITKVWVEDGCTACNACETTCPEVFHVVDGTCYIRASARADGTEDANLDSKSELTGTLGTDLEEQIMEAVAGCAVEIIKVEKA